MNFLFRAVVGQKMDDGISVPLEYRAAQPTVPSLQRAAIPSGPIGTDGSRQSTNEIARRIPFL